MDQRATFESLSQLLSIVSDLFVQKQNASFLVDINGLTRIEGKISFIKQEKDVSKTTITIDNRSEITIDKIVAVNGLFRSDYSEC
jgi:hypothetical protein